VGRERMRVYGTEERIVVTEGFLQLAGTISAFAVFLCLIGVIYKLDYIQLLAFLTALMSLYTYAVWKKMRNIFDDEGIEEIEYYPIRERGEVVCTKG
jgi:hypothetical protein